MSNNVPLQILMAPFLVYTAPVGTSFPLCNVATPLSPWKLLGTSGAEDYDDDGVTIGLDQKFGSVRRAGSTVVRKVSRTEEDLTFTLKIMDMTLDQWVHALNENPKTTTAASSGIPGSEKIKLVQGVDVVPIALLVRG